MTGAEGELGAVRQSRIAELEQEIADVNRAYDAERATLEDNGAFRGQGELDGSDHDPIAELEFERSGELGMLRRELEKLSAEVRDTEADLEAER